METLTLSYRHVGGELSTGALLLSDDVDVVEVLENFENATYPHMLGRLAHHLKENPSALCFFLRTDRLGLSPMKLSEEETALFRTDPAAAIQARTVPPQVVHISVDKSQQLPLPVTEVDESMVPLLVTGYAMRVDCFGEEVFSKARANGDVECPLCGRWGACGDRNGLLFYCIKCDRCFEPSDYQAGEGWVGFSVEDLLKSDASKFFLPRKWHQNGNWISRSELQKMLEEYLEEKEKVTCTR